MSQLCSEALDENTMIFLITIVGCTGYFSEVFSGEENIESLAGYIYSSN